MTDFRSLHVPGDPLLLVNAWDAASARIVEAAGAAAVATTSAGVAWSLGSPDGGGLDRDSAVAVVARIAAAVSVPVTADIESGYGSTPEEVAATVGAIVAAGAVGINIEDTEQRRLRDVDEQSRRIAAVRRADGTVFINARVDTYLVGAGDLAETVRRASAYLAAGADGVFVPGVADPEVIAALVEAVKAPVNVMAGPGSPPVPELAKLGVARISLGASVAQAAYALVQRSAQEAFGTGTYDTLGGGLDYGSLNALLSR
jgi:2-methylisocitrate lyase-like PEP mutase family enzyme